MLLVLGREPPVRISLGVERTGWVLDRLTLLAHFTLLRSLTPLTSPLGVSRQLTHTADR